MSALPVRRPARPAPHHAPTWLGPSPFWDRARGSYPEAPRLLRFATDRFMEELAERLGHDSPDLAALEVTEASDVEQAGDVAKLFQPAHGRFYLVTASLVCEAPGLPDRQVDPSRGEQVGFALRRQGDATGAGTVEYAWVRAGEGEKWTWQPLPMGGEEIADDGEELFPMFPLGFTERGRRRRLWAGLVPTSSRETFEDTAAVGYTAGDPDPREAEVENRVLVSLELLRGDGAVEGDPEQAGEAAAQLLRDLAGYLKAYHLGLWEALKGPRAPSGAAAAALHGELQQPVAEPGGGSWAQALRQALPEPGARETGAAAGPAVWKSPVTAERLRDLLARLRQEEPFQGLPAGEAPEMPKLGPGQRYVIRCVHRCPRCRPWKPAVVSAASSPFLLASFFDADAPARPIRIALPADASVAALRKFKKGVGIVVSAKLRSQLSRVKGLKKDKVELVPEVPCAGGQICMLSIPIITIAAMILLMIIVSLLNLLFWWLPLFKICLPLPKGRS